MDPLRCLLTVVTMWPQWRPAGAGPRELDAIPTGGPDRGATVGIARSGRAEDAPCLSLGGPWLSTCLEAVLKIEATDTAGLLRLQIVGSDWTGGVEVVFGDEGPVSAFVGRPDVGNVATFVGHCRVANGVDSITGIWVFAFPDKNKLDYHMAVKPIPDTLYRLDVG